MLFDLSKTPSYYAHLHGEPLFLMANVGSNDAEFVRALFRAALELKPDARAKFVQDGSPNEKVASRWRDFFANTNSQAIRFRRVGNPTGRFSKSTRGCPTVARPPLELGTVTFSANASGSCLYPTYIRGQAYLEGGNGRAAAAEFDKILDHTGVIWNCWTGALARLGKARADALEARAALGVDADAARVRAIAEYNTFLALWKDADPEIPILAQAKAEYAKLQ